MDHEVYNSLANCQKELTSLRISMARIAQIIGADTGLQVKGKNYEELHDMACIHERGWNHLANMVTVEIEHMKNEIEWMTQNYKEEAAKAARMSERLRYIESYAGKSK